MAFTAKLETVGRSGDPAAFDLTLTYTDSATPDQHVFRNLHITLDPAQTPAQQRAALQAQIIADATLYKQQEATYSGLQSMVGQSIAIP